MKYLILLVIKMYWKTIPPSRRRKCIFRKSCSKYVFETTQKQGFSKGLKAFWFRYKNCRGGFQIFKNPISNNVQIILPSQIIIEREEIAERLLK
ncbi:membrane protein insertion efficiency factor YidD [Flavobacterium sp.]|uniref:membrane protein insertion efficiency factor YidD n=1 Tax=Flavobacterium sp. TaxID=239 RepID=UPI0031DDCF85